MSDQTARVREILAAATLDGLSLRLVGQLDRTEYVAANKAIEALGGKWNRKAGLHVFTVDPADRLAEFIGGGAAPKTDRTAEGYVPTPGPLAARILERYSTVAALPAGFSVLEPSAGDGAFVRAILDANPYGAIVAVEPNIQRLAQIEEMHRVRRVHGTFEEFAAETDERFDAVVMNPPFSVPGSKTIWIDHVKLAFDLLVPGGRLVAIVPVGLAFREDRRHVDVRELVAEHGGYEPLAADAFKESGTGVRAAVLWLDQPAESATGENEAASVEASDQLDLFGGVA